MVLQKRARSFYNPSSGGAILLNVHGHQYCKNFILLFLNLIFFLLCHSLAACIKMNENIFQLLKWRRRITFHMPTTFFYFSENCSAKFVAISYQSVRYFRKGSDARKFQSNNTTLENAIWFLVAKWLRICQQAFET